EMEAEREFLQVTKPRQELQLRVGVQPAARCRIPTRAWKVQLLEAGEAADQFQFGGVDQGSKKVDAGNADLAGRQSDDIVNGIATRSTMTDTELNELMEDGVRTGQGRNTKRAVLPDARLHRHKAHRAHGSPPDRSVRLLLDHDQLLIPHRSYRSYQAAASGQ